MASDYSPLKIELIGTGEQVATWGQTTNTNLGTAIEQAIGGKADVTMSSTTEQLTLTNTNAAQNARALYLNLTGTPGGAAVLEVPAVQKAYVVKNGTTGGFAVTVKVAGQTGVSVPNGATMHLYNNGTDVVNAVTNLPTGATVGGIAIGTGGGTVTSVTGTGTVNGLTLTGSVTSSGSLTLGGTLSNVNLASAVTGTLPVTNGGTGQTSLTAGTLLRGNGGSAVSGLAGTINGQVPAWNSTSSAWQATNTLLVADGTVSAPSIADVNETNTGIYFPSDLDTNLAIALQGEKAFEIESLVYLGETIMGSQTFGLLASAPDEKGLVTSGRYDSVYGGAAYNTSGGSTFMALQVEDQEKARITDAGNVGIGTSNPATRLHVENSGADSYVRIQANSVSCQLGVTNGGQVNFTGAPGTGLNMAIGTTNSRDIAIATNNTVRMNIRSDGNVGIGSSSSTDKLFVIGATSGSSASTINFRNSSSTELLRIRDDGVFYTGGATFSPYNNTTGSAANVFIGASGDLYRSTSSIKYKTDVTDYDKGLNAVMAMRPVYYKDNRTDANKLPGDQRFAGLIAEEIHAAGLQEFVQYNAQNEPDALSYGNMAALFTKAIQELKAELDAVKAELAAMKGN